MTARASDPLTSHLAGQSVKHRAPSQQLRVLAAFYRAAHEGLTDEEAGIKTGLIERPGCCYWKRCSELRQAGYLRSNGVMRRARTGELQAVSCITREGIGYLSAYPKALQLTEDNVKQLKPGTIMVGQDYLLWLEAIMNAARLVVKFDGTDRESLDELQQLVVGRD